MHLKSRDIYPLLNVSIDSAIKGYNIIQSGDVHYLLDFLGANYFDIEKPTVLEIKKALHKIDKRSYVVKKRS